MSWFLCDIFSWSSNSVIQDLFPPTPKQRTVQLSHKRVETWAFSAFKAGSVRNNSLSFHFGHDCPRQARQEQRSSQCFVPWISPCQRMSVMKALLSVLLSPSTQRSHCALHWLHKIPLFITSLMEKWSFKWGKSLMNCVSRASFFFLQYICFWTRNPCWHVCCVLMET